MKNNQLNFINLFAGCGGLSLGLMNAGLKGILAIEKDKFAFETLKHNLIDGRSGPKFNWPNWLPQAPCKINNTFIKKYEKQLRGLRGQVDLIAGGPPCQGFSFAGLRRKNDPRNLLFRHYIEIVELVKPNFLMLENVGGITVDFGKKNNGSRKRLVGRPAISFSERIRLALEMDYHIYAKIIRAADYGVPQIRPRYLMIGIRKNDNLVEEERNNIDPFVILTQNRESFLQGKGLPIDRQITVEEAISDLETTGEDLVECVDSPGFQQIRYRIPRTGYQELLHGEMNGTMPNSLRLVNHRQETKERFKKILANCPKGVQLSQADKERLGINIKKRTIVPLDPGKPSHTLTTLPDDLLHYKEPRILTVREYARLQSFPDWYELKGNYTTGGKRRVKECPRYTQVGNAVPPLLAEALGRLIIKIDQRFNKGF